MLNTARLVSLLLGVLMLIACAERPLMPAGQGRYLLFRHPITGDVAFQLSFASDAACSGALALMQSQDRDDPMLKYVRCSTESHTAYLPVRAVVRNIPHNFLLDIATKSLQDCEEFVAKATTREGKENVEVVAKCSSK